jgi:small-conductance mechanosensitive channel
MYIIEDFVKTIINFLPKIPFILIGIFAGWLIIEVIIFVLKRFLKIAKIKKDISGLTTTICKFILWLILIAVILEAMGFGGIVIAISGSAAIVAIFLSSSIGPTLSNIFSGIFLAGDSDIKVGMKIIVNDGKTKGVIKSIDMRKVRIEDSKGILHVVPNSIVENGEWVVVDRNKKISTQQGNKS